MHNDDVEMTSQPGEVEGEEREPAVGQDGDSQGATSAAHRVELVDRKDAITDGVIRQLIDQIAQLQRVTDSHCLGTARRCGDYLPPEQCLSTEDFLRERHNSVTPAVNQRQGWKIASKKPRLL